MDEPTNKLMGAHGYCTQVCQVHVLLTLKPLNVWTPKIVAVITQQFKQIGRGRTGLVVRASDSGSGDPGSILVGSVCCFLEQETFTPQKYW